MALFHAVLLGLVEGLTELLPVSSTGHLILVDRLLGHQGEADKTLEIVIQLGAVVAIAVYFRKLLAEHLRGALSRRPESLRLGFALAIAFVPAAVVGLALHQRIKAVLFGPAPVGAALLVGGVAMIAIDAWHRRARHDRGLPEVGWRRAAAIGLCQCLALWPGASRSMTTIAGGQLCRLDTKTAAEFSFLLALPTLGAATLFDLYKSGGEVLAVPGGAGVLATATAVSFAVTWLVIGLFLRYVGRVGLIPFGIYRIALGAAVVYFTTR